MSDQLYNEAVAASLTFSFMAAAVVVDRYAFQGLINRVIGNNHAAMVLGSYARLAADLGVDALVSQSIEEQGFRSGVNIASWIAQGQSSSLFNSSLRYLLSNGMLVKESLSEVWQQWQPRLAGDKQLVCLNSAVCDRVSIVYHVPENLSQAPWLSLSFVSEAPTEQSANFDGEQPADPASAYASALVDLHDRALQLGVTRVDLYPVKQDGELQLQVQSWDHNGAGPMLTLSGHYGAGDHSHWWTDKLQEQSQLQSDDQLVNPLHFEVLSRLPALLQGELSNDLDIAPASVASQGDTLLAIGAGDQGGVISDRHFSQGYSLPDLYLDLHQPFDELFEHMLTSLESRRRPGPRRGLSRLAEGLVRSTLYRAAFEWSVNHLFTPESAPVPARPGQQPVAPKRPRPGRGNGNNEPRPTPLPKHQHILVMGQEGAGKTAFIKHLSGQEPVRAPDQGDGIQHYQPVAISGLAEQVTFSEVTVRKGDVSGTTNMKALNPGLQETIKPADHLVWCGDLCQFSRDKDHVAKFTKERQAEDASLFRSVAHGAMAENKTPILAITHADNPVARNAEGLSALDTAIENPALEKLKRLYQRALRGYVSTASPVKREGVFLMADDRAKEPELFYSEITEASRRMQRRTSPQDGTPPPTTDQTQNTWWQAAADYLRTSSQTKQAESP